ncbi:MAG TPA: oxidoreductase, partial [Algoriphagus sp.]|nr:oxidoreductase [Algoriphagus sp.]
FYIVPRHVLGGPGFVAPSDKLRVAGIGVGGMGYNDVSGVYRSEKAEIVALCDVDDTRAQRARDQHPKAPYYKDFRVMLEKEEKNIDAVTVSTPDHMHAVQAMMAMKMGKHVYVQKPLSHDIYEARMLTQAAEKYKVVTQMGNQGSSGDGVRKMVEWYNAGLIGEATKVYSWTNRPVWPQGIPWPNEPMTPPSDLDWDLWLGTAPYKDYVGNLVPFNWRGWWDYGTGALGDVGCHLIDIPFRTLGLKYPTDAECSVGSVFSQMWTPDYHPEGCPASSFITLHFDATPKSKSKIEMTWSDGGIRPSHPDIIPANEDIGGANSANGVLIIGEKGIISTNINDSSPLMPKLYLNDGTTEMGPQSEEGFEREYGHQRLWVEACKAGFGSKEHQGLTSSFDYAGPMTETVLMGNLAIRSYMLRKENSQGRMEFFARKKLLWDGENMRITNLEEANQFVGRQYRKGFEV